MTVTAPPRPPHPSDPVDRDELEALIEEARQRARRRRRIYGAVVAFVGLVAVGVFTVFERVGQSEDGSQRLAAQPSRSAATAPSRISFMTHVRNGPMELHVMNADGSGKRTLTRNAWNVGPPAWSPDRQKLAFERRLDPRKYGGQCGTTCNVEIYVMNADGSGQRNLTHNVNYDGNPVWSPDGSKIALISYRDGRKADIYVMNADGSEQRQLTRHPASDANPVWSHDGRKIAFQSYRDGNWDVYVMNADGSDQRNLMRNARILSGRRAHPAQDFVIGWSPDGRKILFERGVRPIPTKTIFYVGKQLYVMNADGSGQRRLTHRRAERPVWSPDGRKIAFANNRKGDYEIYVMNSDGSNERNVSRNPAWDTGPVWSPNGQKIAFISTRDGRPAIYVMNANGSRQRNLTRGVRLLASFAWAPAPRR